VQKSAITKDRVRYFELVVDATRELVSNDSSFVPLPVN
jgi:hypothetical protein